MLKARFQPCGNGSHGVRRAFFGVFCRSSCLHTIRRRQRWPSDIPSERFESDFSVFRFPFSVFHFPFSGAKVRHSRYSGTQNDAAPYSFARSRRCWHERVAEYSVFCTVREGVPQENTAVSRKYMQSVTEIMQIDEADSIVWCKGVRLICIRLVETNLTPLR